MDNSQLGEYYKSIQNDLQFKESTSSPIMMEFGDGDQIEEQKIYESAHIDDLLETSYVEFQNMEKRKETEQKDINFHSGQSFFQKTNQLFHSELGNKQYKRMKNKKLQCDIGSGVIHESISASLVLHSKMRRLQILKMIKLVRLIFKHVRSFQGKIKKDLSEQVRKNKLTFDELRQGMKMISSKYCEIIGTKDMKILELEQEIARMSQMNEWLEHKMESNEQASQQLIQEIQEQKIKSLAQIKESSMSASLKVEEIQEQKQSLEHQIHYLQQQVQNMQQICTNHETLIKKLEYENEKLEKQNNSLVHKHQSLMRQYQERQQIYNELNIQHTQSNQELAKLIKLNQLYQKQLDSTKEQIRKLEEINVELAKESQEVIITQLNRYQECFNEEIAKLKKEHKMELASKIAIIQSYQQKYQKPLIKSSKASTKTAKNKIFKPIDTNSYARSVKNQQQDHLDAKSDYFESQQAISQKNAYSQVCSRKPLEKNEEKKCYNKVNEKKQLQNCDSKMVQRAKVKSINHLCQRAKKYIPQEKNQSNEPEYVFKAKEHAANLKVKLSEYFRQKQERVFFASDGMLKANSYVKKIQNKPGMLNQLHQKQSMKAYRK